MTALHAGTVPSIRQARIVRTMRRNFRAKLLWACALFAAMRRNFGAKLLWACAPLAAAATAVGCGGTARGDRLQSPESEGAPLIRTTGGSRPPLAVIARDGDGRAAIAVAVTTEGIETPRGALVGVALASLVEARLTLRGIDAVAAGGWNGWRLHATVASPSEAATATDAIRAAMLDPVRSDEPALAAVARKAAALAERPLTDAALVDVARCTGEAFGSPDGGVPGAGEIEMWRKAAHGLGRVAIATTGAPEIADAAANVLARGPPWPRAAAVVAPAWPAGDASAAVYDASADLFPAGARIVVTARTPTAERAVAAAPILGNPRGPLAARLAALTRPAHLRSVVATSHVDGGCLAATIDLAGPSASDAAGGIATAAALALQEIAVELGDVDVPVDLKRELALRAADPRESAERAAWWSLAGRRRDAADGEVRLHLTIGLASQRQRADAAGIERFNAVRDEIDRAILAWHAPVVEARTRVERGQGQLWILLASPCGTWSESASDAGAGATVALAAAATASQHAIDAQVEPFVAADAIGILVHGAARSGEAPEAQATRLADLAARAFAAEALEPDRIAQARIRLLLDASSGPARMRAELAGALAPGHPSWLDPRATAGGIAPESDDAIEMRAAVVRGGPLRVAVIANVDSAQADAAVRGVDRWIARRPGELRVCPAVPTLPPARSGTYAVDEPPQASAEVLLAVPLPSDDAPSRAAAPWIAAALDGPDGLLARALGARPSAAPGAHDDAPEPFARAWSAAVVGSPRASAIVVRIDAGDDDLDAAVAQVRGLLDRVRQGALREEDLQRAIRSVDGSRAEAELDPRARTIALWRGAERSQPPPPLEALRSAAAAVLHDDALVIVAGRPPRTPAAPLRAFPLY